MLRTNCGLSTYYTPGVNRAKQNSHFFEGLISWMHLNLHDPNDFETPKYSFMHSIKKELSPWSFSADTSLVLKSNVVLALFSQVFPVCPLWRVKCAFFLFPTSRAAVQQICVSLIPNVIFQPLVLSVDPFHICCKPWHLHPVAQQ